MAGIGLENRSSILPIPNIPQGPGVFGPDYSFADNVKLPGEVGVRDGSSMRDVTDAVKAVGYYVDTIGFGESSSPLSRGLGVKPLGVNFWMKTGLTCSNGAEMWQYVEGIPRGDALGQRVADGLRSAGMPGMRGLAPGIVEDAKAALNPTPVLQAVFGSGYPVCRFERRPVGDQDRRIQNPSTGKFYVENPNTVVNGQQGRWTYAGSLTKAQWDAAQKTHCPSGYPKRNHRDMNCNDRLESLQEGFSSDSTKTAILIGTAVLGSLILLKVIHSKKAI
jgi:hypothetical protein